jgi:transcriptional regulator with XRE-family HTH domain
MEPSGRRPSELRHYEREGLVSVDERSKLISRLQENFETRATYVKAKLGMLVPSQIRALRLQSEMPRQSDLARAAKMHQSRISKFETPGAANLTLETLARLAAAFKVGLVVKFVPFSELLSWDNSYSQDTFYVTPIDSDFAFMSPAAVATSLVNRIAEPASAVGEGTRYQPSELDRLPPTSVGIMGGILQRQSALSARAGA